MVPDWCLDVPYIILLCQVAMNSDTNLKVPVLKTNSVFSQQIPIMQSFNFIMNSGTS